MTDFPTYLTLKLRARGLLIFVIYIVIGDTKANKSTVGVDVGDWIYGKKLPIKFSTWDFAGQVKAVFSTCN